MAFLFKKPEDAGDQVAKQHEKLKGYHELVRDILERAIAKHRAEAYDDATKLCEMGLTVCNEALGMEVAHLGITNSNVGMWRSDLQQWREAISTYLSKCKSGMPATSISPPQVKAKQRDRSEIARRAAQPVARGNAALTPRASTTRKAGGSSHLLASSAEPQTRGQSCSKEEDKLREMVLSEVLDSKPSVGWDQIAGLERAKQVLQELVILPALRSDLFKGIRSPARGLLLYGPPGNGKTMLARALAKEANATFFALSASSLTSRWMGEGEKLVRMLFTVARERTPAVIFLDEIDSILSARSSGEHEASRRLKTEFLVQFDGMVGQDDHVVVIGATNRPQELDDAVRRRLEKRIYIPLPDKHGRRSLLRNLVASAEAKVSLHAGDLEAIAKATEGYSGADLTALCREAAMQPLRELGPRVREVRAKDVRPVTIQDFADALETVKPSVDVSQLNEFETWTRKFGSLG